MTQCEQSETWMTAVQPRWLSSWIWRQAQSWRKAQNPVRKALGSGAVCPRRDALQPPPLRSSASVPCWDGSEAQRGDGPGQRTRKPYFQEGVKQQLSSLWIRATITAWRRGCCDSSGLLSYKLHSWSGRNCFSLRSGLIPGPAWAPGEHGSNADQTSHTWGIKCCTVYLVAP